MFTKIWNVFEYKYKCIGKQKQTLSWFIHVVNFKWFILQITLQQIYYEYLGVFECYDIQDHY